MQELSTFVHRLLVRTGLGGAASDILAYVTLIAFVALVAWAVFEVCRRLLVPLIIRITLRTEAVWDDYLLNPKVLRAASFVLPAVVVWGMLPPLFSEFPRVESLLVKATAIYITVTTINLGTAFIDSFKLFDVDRSKRTAMQQYFHSFCGVLKIIIVFIGVIVIVSVIIDRSPLRLMAGLGATSAILMLVFKDTIMGLVAGVRLTSNDMVRKGDWITVSKHGADGVVEDITLSTVKVRNFDQTIVTLPPQRLVEDSFQNWRGMSEGVGRRVKRVIYIDFNSVTLASAQLKDSLLSKGFAVAEDVSAPVVNLTLLRLYVERWLAGRDDVCLEMTFMVRQLEPTSTGLPIEIYFFLKHKEWKTYEHHLAEVMETVYALIPEFGLRVYQRV